MRNMVFLSHANPEDNEFTLWLALRLAREGYPVWCDLTKLLGGEIFWRDIEIAIRERTAKFLYVLSRVSNSKDGPLNELDVALTVERQHELKDFVIPLRIDDLSFHDIHIRLGRRSAIDCCPGWAAAFGQLLKKLHEDGVARDARFNAQAVAAWWHTASAGEQLLIQEPESHLSNWFPIADLPSAICVHKLRPTAPSAQAASRIFPTHTISDYMVSFAQAADIDDDRILKTRQVALEYALDPRASALPLTYPQFRYSVTRLILLAWEQAMRSRNMPTHGLSDRRTVYFTPDMFTSSRVSFTLPDGFSGSRALVGFFSAWDSKAQTGIRKHWHYGLSADVRLTPYPVLSMRAHVLFSDDGRTIWESTKRLHSARRSRCKDWWNDAWRDRMLAALAWLSGGADCIELPVSSCECIRVLRTPVMFESPVSYSNEYGRHADPAEIEFDATSYPSGSGKQSAATEGEDG